MSLIDGKKKKETLFLLWIQIYFATHIDLKLEFSKVTIGIRLQHASIEEVKKKLIS